MDELQKALHELLSYYIQARKDLSNVDACKKCAEAGERIIKLSDPRIATIYKEMKRRGTTTGCQECTDLGKFSMLYLLLLERGEKYSTRE